MVCPHNAGSMLKPSTPKTLGDVTIERIGFNRMDSIPENLTQCAFNFEALSTHPIEDIPTPTSQANPQKRCPKCEQFKAATTDFFPRNKKSRDGLYAYCKKCIARPPKPSDVPEGHKRCPTCKNIYPLTEEFFNRSKAQKIGFDYQCKECKSKRGKEYSMRTEVREKRLLREKIWNDTHKEEHKEYYKVYNQVNKEAESERSKRYYQAHKEHTRDRHKLHYQQNKELYRSIQRAYRARQQSVSGTHTPEQIREQLKRQKCKCYYCQKRLQKIKGKYIYHIEHTFPLSRVVGTNIPANSIDYIVLACPTCNLSKGNKFPWEWGLGGRLF